ncbi:hypothetical protein Goshw_020822, partial [Gossypium schwendimanii]|nr:hypothetical protein [Gossypium schwendimanii]
KIKIKEPWFLLRSQFLLIHPSGTSKLSNHQAGPGNSAQHFPPPPLLPPHGGGEGAGSIRPGSMADRARLVNIPVPEPRHLCKTCKRYWTRGGALRNVPVGGGCHRNKRSKEVYRNLRSEATGKQLPVPSHRFMAPLHHHTEFGGGTDIGLNYGSVPASVGGTNDNLSYQKGSGLSGGGAAGASYQFESQGVEPSGCGVRPKISSSMATLMASVKMEDNDQQKVRFSRPFLDVPGKDQYWGGTPWTDLSCFTSSSTKNPL